MTVHHVSLEVRPDDLAAEVRFWAALGFARVEPPPTLADRSVWVQKGATQIHLLRTDDPVIMRAGHVAVVVDDYDAVAAALDVEARPQHWGVPRGFARSPSGHTVEVMAAPPPAD